MAHDWGAFRSGAKRLRQVVRDKGDLQLQLEEQQQQELNSQPLRQQQEKLNYLEDQLAAINTQHCPPL